MPRQGSVEHLQFWTREQGLNDVQRRDMARSQNQGAYGDGRDEHVNYVIPRQSVGILQYQLPDLQTEPVVCTGEQTAVEIEHVTLGPGGPRPFSSADNSRMRYAVFFPQRKLDRGQDYSERHT
jgi:hypothetical protein